MRTTTNNGFIALMSVIIISLVLLLAVVTLGQRGITGRFILLDYARKEITDALADACVSVGIISVINDPLFTGPFPPVTVGSRECTLVSITPNNPSSGKDRIRAQGTEKGATTNYEVVVDTSTGAIESWKEVQSF